MKKPKPKPRPRRPLAESLVEAARAQAHAAADVVIISGEEYIRGWDAACAMVGMSRVPLWRRVRAGTFPAPIVHGRAVLFRKAAIDAYLASLPVAGYAGADARDVS